MGNKKMLMRILLIIVTVLVIAAVCVIIFLPVTYAVDKSLIKVNPDYNVEAIKIDGFTSLFKTDSEGHAIDSDFKIIGFTDTHFDTHKDKGDVTMDYLIRNIVNEKPDFVVFVGDNITSAINRRRARQLANVMEDMGVYWSMTLGNHEGDNPWSISRKQMVKLFSKYPHCLLESDDKYTDSGEKVWGYGNHVINLLDGNMNIVRSLYFIDGGSYMTEEDMVKYDAEFDDKDHNDYDYVKDSQIQWYKETVAKINEINRSPVKSVVFDHIALPEYKVAYEKITKETEVTMNEPEYNVCDEDGDYILAGQRREIICNSGHNSGFFDAILSSGSTDAVVCGHDHINDFVLSYKGVILAYNVPSGYSSYNLVSKKMGDKLMKGYSRYIISKDGTFSMFQLHNADLYPDEQEEINNLYR